MTAQAFTQWELAIDIFGLVLCGAALTAVALHSLWKVRAKRAGFKKRKSGRGFSEALRLRLGDPLAEAFCTIGGEQPARNNSETPPSRYDAAARLCDMGMEIPEISERLKIPQEEIGLMLRCGARRGGVLADTAAVP